MGRQIVYFKFRSYLWRGLQYYAFYAAIYHNGTVIVYFETISEILFLAEAKKSLYVGN